MQATILAMAVTLVVGLFAFSEVLDCGDSKNQTSASVTQAIATSGSSAARAERRAKDHVLEELRQHNGVGCGICPNQDQCAESVTVDDANWTIAHTTVVGDLGDITFVCAAAHIGAYTTSCADC